MARDVKTQLRITTWPQSPLPLPPLQRVASRLDREQEVILPEVAEWDLVSPLDPQIVTSTGETYLHLRRVDLDDRPSVAGFVARFGPLGGRDAAIRLSRSRGYGSLNHRREHSRKQRALRSAILQAHPSAAQLGEPTWQTILSKPLSSTLPVVETLTEFRYAAACLQDLTDAWLAVRNGDDPSKLPWNSLADRSIAAMNAPNATAHLTSTLEFLLQLFGPRLGLAWQPSRPIDSSELEKLFHPADSMVISAVRETRSAPLYAICALELFNHIVENADYWTCVNERCRRTFVRQEGRSQMGQHRSRGVRFCSASCARATAQRDYRRRQRRQRP